MATHWILTNNGTWHAWPVGKTATACGRIDREHLRKFPAMRIVNDLPLGEKSCASCTRKTGVLPTTGDKVAKAWAVHIRLHLSHIHARVSEKVVCLLAERLAEVGPPDSLEGKEVFDQLRLFLLRPLREQKKDAMGRVRSKALFPHLKDALESLPPNTKALLKIAEAVRHWRARTNGTFSPGTRYRLDHVVQTILEIPAIEPYVAHQTSRGLYSIALIFHPNTLQRARKDTALRGLFSGSTEYWNATADQLNIVND